MGTLPVQRLKQVRAVNTIINIFVTLSHKSIMERKKFLIIINPITPMNDQDKISLYNIKQTSGENKLRDYKLIQYQIFQTDVTRTTYQTVRRINNEILGVKG